MEKALKSRSGGGGSKLNRSETVTIRLDPKLRYLTELAARQQRRTASSFIEWAIERALDSVILREEYDRHEGAIPISLAHEAETLWDTDEPDRIARLGLHYPALLTHDEQVLWKLIRECGLLWLGQYDKQGYWRWELNMDSLIFKKLREHWDAFNQVASGEADKSILPKWAERKPIPPKLKDGDFPPLEDDDIPF